MFISTFVQIIRFNVFASFRKMVADGGCFSNQVDCGNCGGKVNISGNEVNKGCGGGADGSGCETKADNDGCGGDIDGGSWRDEFEGGDIKDEADGGGCGGEIGRGGIDDGE